MLPDKLKILAIESSCDETAAAVVNSKPTTNNEQQKNTSKLSVGDCRLSVDILSNVVSSQIDLHKKFGGVFPELASRAHTEQIIPVIQESLENSKSEYRNSKQILNSKSQMFKTFKFRSFNIVSNLVFSASDLLKDIDVLAVTCGPGLIGSLLIGVNTAKTLAFVNKKPIIGINHWLGHIYSCFARTVLGSQLSVLNENSKTKKLNENWKLETENFPSFPLLALIVSGGHTGLVLMKSHTEYETIGQTLDDAAGEAFDKVAKLLQLPYPGGPSISKAAAEFLISKSEFLNKPENPNIKSKNNSTIQQFNNLLDIKFPRSMLNSGDFNFSFSGLKTSVLYKVKELESQGITIKSRDEVANHYKSLIAYEFQQAVIDILIGKTLQAAEKFNPKSICLCGGVSANKELRQQMSIAIENWKLKTGNSVSFHIPPMALTGDNAAMIGIAAAYQMANGKKSTTYDQVNANANLEL